MPVAFDIGDDHLITFVSWLDEVHVGINVRHHTPDGEVCWGWVPFAGRGWANAFNGNIQAWDVVDGAPETLTLTPSIKCRACGDHGFITHGKWVKA